MIKQMLNSKIFVNSAVAFGVASAFAMSKTILHESLKGGEEHLRGVINDLPPMNMLECQIIKKVINECWLNHLYLFVAQSIPVLSFLTAVGISASHILLKTNGKNPPAFFTTMHTVSMTSLCVSTPLVCMMYGHYNSACKEIVKKLPFVGEKITSWMDANLLPNPKSDQQKGK